MRRKFLSSFMAVLLASAFALSACGDGGSTEPTTATETGGTTAATENSGESAPAGEVAKLTYTFWGSDMEREAQMNAISAFNDLHKGEIEVTATHIPSQGNEYTTKITAMQASGTNPDIGYMPAGLAYTWAREGILYDIFELMEADPVFEPDMFVDDLFYMYAEGKSFSTTSSINPFALFYDPAVFDEAGVEYPPASYADAWDWDTFVENAKKLTVDLTGKNATEEGFDPLRIRQFGVMMNPDDMYILQLMLDSNGADLLNEEGTELALDTPEAKEAMQKLYDLIYVHHVAPIPGDYANLPSGADAIRNRQFAMVATGQWTLLDFYQMEVPYEVGVLPKMKEPRNLKMAGVRTIFKNTKYPEAAWELYKFLANPEGAMDLYADGLWMPTLKEWYEDEEKYAMWAENDAHSENYKEVFADGLFNGTSTPNWVLRINNYDELVTTTIRPALQQFWFGDMTVDEVVADVTTKASPFVQGYNPGMFHASAYWKFDPAAAAE